MLTSLQQAWGAEKQDKWQCYKQATIHAGTQLLQNGCTYQEFYKFLADKRHEIAVNLKQDGANKIGVERKTDLYTTFGYETRYDSFFPYLLHEYNRIIPEEKRNLDKKFIKSDHMETFPWNEVKGIYNTEIVLDNGAKFTHRFYDCLDARNNPLPYLEVWNPSVKDIAIIDKEIETIFNQLDAMNNDDKILAIKKIAYLQSVATKCERGSAAIVEMSTQALLNHYGLEYAYQEKNTTIDIEALYSSSFEDFNQKVSISPPNADATYKTHLAKAVDQLVDYKKELKDPTNKAISDYYQRSPIGRDIKVSCLDKLIQFFNGNFKTTLSSLERSSLERDASVPDIVKPYLEVIPSTPAIKKAAETKPAPAKDLELEDPQPTPTQTRSRP